MSIRKAQYLVVTVLMLFSHLGWSQRAPVTLSTDMFNSHQRLFLAELDGWLFKAGDIPHGASQNIDLSDWIALNPAQLSPDMADENGRVEGWFRIRFLLDESFEDLPLDLAREFWAATDIYIDGEKIHSFGSTGAHYVAYNPILKYPKSLQLEVGKEYVMAIHFVDYESTFTQREIRMTPQNYKRLLSLTGPEYTFRMTKTIKDTHIYGAIAIAVSFFLFFHFWLLVYLNQDQTIFKLIAWLTTFVLLTAILIFFNTFFEMPYWVEKIRFILMVTFQLLSTLFGLFVMEWMLTKRISSGSIIILVFMSIVNLLAHLFSISLPFGVAFLGMLIFYGRLIFTYSQTIRGSQWAVVAGVVVPTVLTLIYISIHKYSLDLFNEYDEVLLTSSILSAPIFLLGYISSRFKETLQQVTQEAESALKANEEKKEILADQNIVLENQVTARTFELENSLEELKSTQSQLIHSEKMASLGELTAGIAHEIQNPLNFVNNFSDLNKELIADLKEAVANNDQEEVADILRDLEENEDKVTQHGKRAEQIVKSMLQHSRSGSGEKELTDINALCDEYLRLSYHGFRAKDKSFNSDFKLKLDKSLPKVNVVPQDIGRVLLNLLNNAFQAVHGQEEALVKLTTQKINDQVQITISDNGPGIPDDIKDKIFQPFFTTKPTGEGTGLGLSMSYDIVTKGHGGDLKVETVLIKGSKFVIMLPVTFSEL